jgi:hypothetical protein
MSLSKIALVACGLSAAFIGFVSAQDNNPWDLKDRQAFFMDPTGQMKRVTLNDTGHAMMMKEGKHLAAGAMLYRSGGKLYLLENQKMPDGTMMFDRAGNWMAGSN